MSYTDASLNAVVLAYNTAKTDLSDKVCTLEQCKSTLFSLMEHAKKQIELNCDSSLNALFLNSDASVKSLTSVANSCVNAQTAHNASKTLLETAKSDVVATVATLKKMLVNTTTDLKTVQLTVDSNTAQIEKISESKSKAQSSKKSLQKDHGNADSDSDSDSDSDDDNSSSEEVDKKSIAVLTSQIESYTEEHNKLQLQNIALSSTVNTMTTALDVTRRQITKLEKLIGCDSKKKQDVTHKCNKSSVAPILNLLSESLSKSKKSCVDSDDESGDSDDDSNDDSSDCDDDVDVTDMFSGNVVLNSILKSPLFGKLTAPLKLDNLLSKLSVKGSQESAKSALVLCLKQVKSNSKQLLLMLPKGSAKDELVKFVNHTKKVLDKLVSKM